MKLFKILSQPVLLISVFLLVLISGEAFGGPYLLYLILALPHGGIHALLAVAGIALILFSFAKYQRSFHFFIGPLLNIIGVFCLVGSLYYFFSTDTAHYNYSTFEEPIPIAVLCIFAGLVTIFIIDNLMRLTRKKMMIL